MISFVQECSRQEFLARPLVEFAADILRANRDLARAGYGLAEVRNAEAAFVLRVMSFAMNDLGVNQDELRAGILLEGDIDDRQTLGNANLGCRESHTMRRVHRLEH